MITNQAAIQLAIPEYPTDKVLGVFTGTFSVGAPTALQGSNYTENAQNHGFGDTCLPQLIYSTGGAYNDQDMTVPRLTGAFPVFQTLDVTAYTTSTQVVVAATNWYDNVASAGFSWTISYKVFLLAKKNQGILTPLPTSQVLRYSSKENYQKIAIDDITPISIAGGGTGSTVIGHSVGVIPVTRAYLEYSSSGNIWPTSPNHYPNTGGVTFNNPLATTIKSTSTTVEYDFQNSSGSTVTANLHYRIYLDS